MIKRLDQMGDYLRDQRSFRVRARTEIDEVLPNGQKIQLSGTGDLQVRRPDGLRADISSDRKHRQFFYDGANFTIYGPRTGYYATVPAPPTLIELVDQIYEHYGVELPLADLFLWGTSKLGSQDLSQAIYVGTSRIGGVETDQFALRQPGLDWQIWIERGARPLPRKLVLTTTEDDARPQYSIELDWTLAPPQDERMFSFVPPKGSQQISIAEVTPLSPSPPSPAPPSPAPPSPTPDR